MWRWIGAAALALMLTGCSRATGAIDNEPSASPPNVGSVASSSVSPPAPSPTLSLLTAGQRLQLDAVRLFGNEGWATDTADRTSGAVLTTDDGGATWRSVTPWQADYSIYLDTAYFTSATTAVVATDSIGADQLQHTAIWRTTDRGRSWHQAAAGSGTPGGGRFSFDSASDGWYLAAGEPTSQDTFQSAQVWRTHDGGVTWTLVSEAPAPPASPEPGAVPSRCGKGGGVGARDSQTAWIAGGCIGAVTLLVTHNAGYTWTPQSIPAPAGGFFCQAGPCSADAPQFPSSSFGYFVLTDYANSGGIRTTLYQTYDGGSSWFPRPMPQSGAAAMVDQADGYMTTFYGSPSPGIYRTRDGGRSWVGTVFPEQVMSIECATVSTCWGLRAGNAGVLHPLEITSDAWSHWRDVTPIYL